jgi:uncharacterized membrane protein
MFLLILGLVAFFGIHVVPMFPPLRAALVKHFGENRYKGTFSAVAGIGLVLIAVGYAYAQPGAQLFEPVAAARLLAPLAMIVSFVLVAAANMKTHIRRVLKHPMLLGIGIWSAIHLLANGRMKASIVFGTFLAFVVIDLISAILRGAAKSFQPQVRFDVIVVVGGSLLAYYERPPGYAGVAVKV